MLERLMLNTTVFVVIAVVLMYEIEGYLRYFGLLK